MIETLPLHHVSRVISLLARSQVVAYPTGTSYGLGVNALDQHALEKLSAIKQRAEDKAYTVLLPGARPERFVLWTEEERRAFDRLKDRPLTILVRPTKALEHFAKDGRVGIRTPDHPFTRELARALPFPVTATSANSSGEPAAQSPEDLATLAGNTRLHVVDGGTLPARLSSTVARKDDGTWTIIRRGDVTTADLTGAAKL